MGTTGKMGLPSHIDRVTLHHTGEPQGGVHAVVTPREDGAFDGLIVDGEGNVRLTLEGYRTMTLPDPIDAEKVKPLQAAMSGAANIS